ncbi:uncharacterized protein LOC113492925 [Trichoplusia ni]|uniref:Uncharacterized protein LOC113492925 n=1 Tax=Trichoplusia ni TaxID=7111 RepID=A0A7E5VDV1_TRINI|nr:uncharacterized protein LOC113492925 [Trichoplusia ni]
MNDLKNTHDSRGNYKYATILNQGDSIISKDSKPKTEFKKKEVLSKVVMDAVKNVQNKLAGKRFTRTRVAVTEEESPEIKSSNKDALSKVVMDAVKNVQNKLAGKRFARTKVAVTEEESPEIKAGQRFARTRKEVTEEDSPEIKSKNKDALTRIMKAVQSIHKNRASDKRPPMGCYLKNTRSFEQD